jgi:DNA-binding response OmpR family regulator
MIMKITTFGANLIQLTRYPVLFPVNCYLVREDDGFTLIDGTPLAGVKLALSGNNTQTDSGGNFQLLDVPAGTNPLSIDTTPVHPQLPMYGMDVTAVAGQITHGLSRSGFLGGARRVLVRLVRGVVERTGQADGESLERNRDEIVDHRDQLNSIVFGAQDWFPFVIPFLHNHFPGFIVRAMDGESALAAVRAEPPSLVVLDLMLPGLDGRAVVRAVRGDDEAAATPILIVSARGSTLDRIAGLEDGADDYLPKPFSPAELVLRVKSILRRTAPATTDATSRPPLTLADLTIDLDRYEVTRVGQQVPLTRVEFRLLTSLIEAGGRVLTRDQLLDAVYGRDGADVLDRTVDVHIGRLRDKLGDDADDPRYVATVRGIGYRAAIR